MSIEAHKHCQATVLSANGTGAQNGATWSTLYQGSSDLLSLNNILSSPWVDKFKNNKGNITEDLRSILELIDSLVQKLKTGTKMTFSDGSGNSVGEVQIPAFGTCQLDNFGRDVVLTINGQQLKFNTIKSKSGETTSIDLNIDSTTESGRLIEQSSDGKIHVKVDDSLKIGDNVKQTNLVGIGSSGQLVEGTISIAQILDKIYPVGSIYTTIDKAFTPGTVFGGTWVVVGKGRCLFGCDQTDSNVGQNLPSTLPAFSISSNTMSMSLGGGNVSDYANRPQCGRTGQNLGTLTLSGSIVATGKNGSVSCSSSNDVMPPSLGVIFWRRTR